MVIDTKTTGFKKGRSKIIDLGCVWAEFNLRTGLIHRVIERYSGFEDPGLLIPPEITDLTGIQDTDGRPSA